MAETNRLRERLPRRLVGASLRHPARVLCIWLLLAGLALPGALALRIETSTDSVLDRASEPWSFYEESKEIFGGDELIVVALSGEEPFGVDLLEETIRLTGVLEEIEGVRRVDSLATVPHIRGGADGSLVLDAALESGIPESPEAREALLSALLEERIAPRSLISDDGRVVALNLYLDAEIEGSFDALIGEIESAVEASGDIRARVSGVPIFRTQINLRTGSEVATFSVVTLLLIGLLFRMLFGSLPATFVPLSIGVLGGWLILGAMGGLGIPLSLSTMILPSILLALGCAYSTHFVFAMGQGRDASQRRKAAEDVALPVVLSGLTTAIGFVAIAFVPIEAMRQVGGLGALGTLLITAAVSTLAPPILDRWPARIDRGLGERWIGARVRPAILRLASRPGRVAGVALVIGAAFGIALPGLGLQTDATRWFSEGSEVRDAYDGIRRDLSGISPINVVITPTGQRTVTEPDVVESLTALSEHLRQQNDVGKVLSIADSLLSVHEVFDPASSSIESRRVAEQYMLLLASREQ
ncbi:MAG: efflux RND transporter permease subunit, partial [bacterium]